MKKLLNILHFGIVGTGVGFFMTALSALWAPRGVPVRKC